MRVALLSHNACAGDAVGNHLAEKVRFFRDRAADVRVFLETNRRIHPEVALKAFRLKKRDAQGNAVASYDVHLTPQGHIECECQGWLRYGHCRHQETLQAAGMMPVSVSANGSLAFR